ncbi:hypothetical protein OPT61_g1866 [Boeremia exigua]|uniref:Uncharacterized protein n=1 Tax=Boeremia exigua TaxID=749465 RepID=A0ACC2INK2_9PLEO|nr:hypothetical protein OPT61_g1866 [Boeremia exigua]
MAGPSGVPPTSKVSSKRAAKWDAVIKDAAKMAAIDKMIRTSKYYDPSVSRTRKRRAMVRGDFELACETLYRITKHKEIWVKDEIIERQMNYLALYAEVAVGMLGDKIKANTMYEVKNALYWWNYHFVQGFSTIFHKWHVKMMYFIHQIATTKSLTTVSLQKNFLSSNELLMLFGAVMNTTSGVDDWKQHYAAWLLIWRTGARPGLIAVADGYSAEDVLSDGSLRRYDETLRWNDVTWLKNKGGQLSFRLKLRLHRDPYTTNHTGVEAERTFLYVPIKSGPLALDLTLILLGIAVNRGLFPGELDYAVFISAETQDLTHKKPMHVNRLTPKLQEGLVLAGLPSNNTMSSFRREATHDTKLDDTEKGKELAGQAPDLTAIMFYDTIGLGDADLEAFMTGIEGISREDAWKKIDPVVRSAYVKHDDNFKASLKDERDARVEAAVQTHPDVGKNAQDLKEHIDKTRTFLQSHLSDGKHIPEGYNRTTVSTLKTLLQEVVGDDAEDRHEYYDGFLSLARARRANMQKVRYNLRMLVLEDIAKEMESLQKINTTAATRIGGGASGQIEKEESASFEDINRLVHDNLAVVELIRQEDAEDARCDREGLVHDGTADDENVLDEGVYSNFTAAQISRPTLLSLDDGNDNNDVDEIVLVDELTETDALYQQNSKDKRIEFLQEWIAKASIQRHLQEQHSLELTGIEAASKVSRKRKAASEESEDWAAGEDEGVKEAETEAEVSDAAPAYVGKGKGRA